MEIKWNYTIFQLLDLNDKLRKSYTPGHWVIKRACYTAKAPLNCMIAHLYESLPQVNGFNPPSIEFAGYKVQIWVERYLSAIMLLAVCYAYQLSCSKLDIGGSLPKALSVSCWYSVKPTASL